MKGPDRFATLAAIFVDCSQNAVLNGGGLALKPLRPGVWGILATPFRDEDLTLDLASLERLVVHYRFIGATGVVALGVLGEASRLNSSERSEILQRAVRAAAGMPVVAGVAALASAPAIEE